MSQGVVQGSVERPAPRSEGRLRRGAVPILVALVALSVYANNLSHGLVMDDEYLVLHNREIRLLRNLPRMFTHPWGSSASRDGQREMNRNYWRPMVSVISHSGRNGRVAPSS